MHTHENEIALSYSHLHNGEIATAQMCPGCKGGSSNERTLSVGRDGHTLWWRCWRASCDVKGRTYDGAVATLRAPVGKKRLTYQTRPPTEEEIQILQAKVGTGSKDDVLWTDQYGGRACYPVISNNNRRVGRVLRSYKGSTPKSLTDVPSEYGKCSWHGDLAGIKKVVVVEDIASAMKVSQTGEYVGVALMGTELTNDKLHDLLSVKAGLYVICLDADASNLAIHMTLRLSNFALCKMKALTKDIKDMGSDELIAFFKELKDEND